MTRATPDEETGRDAGVIAGDGKTRKDSPSPAQPVPELVLGTASNPEATFTLTEPIELGAEASGGDSVEVTASGELTINGVTNPVEITLEAQLIDTMILVTGTTDISFGDYEVVAPTAPVVLSVEDHGTVEVQLWLARQ